MNINHLLIFTLLLLYINFRSNTYENFTGEVNQASCVERILNYECLDEDKKNKLNEDCDSFELYISTGLVNISCDDKTLYDTLLCNKMLSEGACECSYGRKQIAGICNVDPINISCPAELQSKDLAIIEKIEELQTESRKCENVERKEKELLDIAGTLQTLMKGKGLLKGSNTKNYIIILVIVCVVIGVILYIKKKKIV
jgi:hypothetical protein